MLLIHILKEDEQKFFLPMIHTNNPEFYEKRKNNNRSLA